MLFAMSYAIRNLKKKFIEEEIEIPRSIPTHKESITSADLHVFEDASIVANCAAVYAVVDQPSAISQGLVAS